MKLTQLEKAQKLYARVKELDGEIIEVEKLAQLISSKKTSIKLSLKVNDLEKVNDSDKVTLDEDGSLKYGSEASSMASRMFGLWMPSPFGSCTDIAKKDAPDSQFKSEISDSVCLGILGVLLASKMEARELAIKALNKIGVQI